MYYSRLYVHQDSSYYHFHELQNARFAYNDSTSLSGYHCIRFYIREYYIYTSSFSEVTACSGNQTQNKLENIFLPFFSQAIRTGAHANSVKAVIDGEADVLCLDENIRLKLSATHDGRKQLAQLRSLNLPILSTTEIVNIHSDNKKCKNEETICNKITNINKSKLLLERLSTPDGRLGPNPVQPVLVAGRIPAKLQERIRNAFLEVALSMEARRLLSAECYVPIDHSHYDTVRYFLLDREDEVCHIATDLVISDESR
jgi:ABC-type phosphate/phosphonate transport system substrate-binding protein